MADKTFEVTMHDTDGSRQWLDPDTREPSDTSVLQVHATSADKAKEFAEQQNPGLTATEASEVK